MSMVSVTIHHYLNDAKKCYYELIPIPNPPTDKQIWGRTEIFLVRWFCALLAAHMTSCPESKYLLVSTGISFSTKLSVTGGMVVPRASWWEASASSISVLWSWSVHTGLIISLGTYEWKYYMWRQLLVKRYIQISTRHILILWIVISKTIMYRNYI